MTAKSERKKNPTRKKKKINKIVGIIVTCFSNFYISNTEFHFIVKFSHFNDNNETNDHDHYY